MMLVILIIIVGIGFYLTGRDAAILANKLDRLERKLDELLKESGK